MKKNAAPVLMATLKCPVCYRPLPVYGQGAGYFQDGDDVCETCQEPIRRAGDTVIRVPAEDHSASRVETTAELLARAKADDEEALTAIRAGDYPRYTELADRACDARMAAIASK